MLNLYLMNAKYLYETLQLVEPAFNEPLTDLIIELDHLRRKRLAGSSCPQIFFQLKEIFHILESLESARIEGNRTTLAELIEQKIEGSKGAGEEFKEIANVEKAIKFVDETVKATEINRAFLSEVHKIVVGGLSPNKEGDKTPGQYRKSTVRIANAAHTPPDFLQVEDYMAELIRFINQPTSSKHDLIKTALAHHRFVWIHPFANGNGRTVRLLTYAMLVKQGFRVNVGQILNPAAIFCTDRQKYYDFLSRADSGARGDLLAWCEYVLSGLKAEIEKIDNLLDYEFLSEKILIPALAFSLDRKIITQIEEKILKIAVREQIFQAADLQNLFPGKAASEISRTLRGLRTKEMIVPVKENARKYHIRFFNNYLLRGVIAKLVENGFVPFKENQR